MTIVIGNMMTVMMIMMIVVIMMKFIVMINLFSKMNYCNNEPTKVAKLSVAYVMEITFR